MKAFVSGGLICLVALLLGQTSTLPQRVLMPGDWVEINCEQSSSLCVRREINSDGRILLPILGPVSLATLSAREASLKLKQLAREQGIDPNPTLSVEPVSATTSGVEVTGAVAHPIHLRFSHYPSVKDLIDLASPTDYADRVHIYLSRGDGTGLFVSSSETLPTKSGDRITVFVSTAPRWIEVVGGVNHPVQIDFSPGMSLGTALSSAGGVAARGNGSRIVIQRGGEQIPASIPDDAGLKLQLGDVVKITVANQIKHVVVTGFVSKPGLVDLKPGLTASQAIAACSGVIVSSAKEYWVQVKSGVGANTKSRRYSLKEINLKHSPDPILSENDVIEVVPSDLKSSR